MNLLKNHYLVLLMVLVLSISITSISFAQQGLINQEGLSEHTLTYDGVEREYLLYVPQSYTGDEPLPLIMNFHPLGAGMTFQYIYTQFDRYTEEYPAIIVMPQGLPTEVGDLLSDEAITGLVQDGGMFERLQESGMFERLPEGDILERLQASDIGGRLQGRGNGGRLQERGNGGRLQGRGNGEPLRDNSEELNIPVWNIFGQTDGTLADDVGFVQALIDELSATYNVDSSRIYAVGGSMGGMFSFELACQLPDTFAAVAGISGGMIPMTIPRCNVERPVPILQIHSTDDPLVPYELVSLTLDFWTTNNQTSSTPTIEVVSDSNTGRDIVIEHHIYDAGLSDTTVEHYKVVGGSHLVFGMPQATGVEINSEILRFFWQFDLDGRMNE